MKTKVVVLLLVLVAVTAAAARGDKKIKLKVIPADAVIWVNGQQVASGSAEIKVPDGGTVQVGVEKVGYVTITRNYVNDKINNIPKTDLFTLPKDPSYDSSTSTDLANKDIDIKTDRPEEEAWRLLSQIVMTTFDVIEVTDHTSGYLRTAWTLKRFDPGYSVRTRLIVKIGNSKPVMYKVKLVSEVALAGTSPREDEKWREWDRLLRTYLDVIPEIQSRLAKSDR